MRALTDFKAELILVCNSLDAGGIERVVATLANEWARRGRRVCVITLHDRRRFYSLDPPVRHIVIDRAGLNRLADLLRWLAARLRRDGAPGPLELVEDGVTGLDVPVNDARALAAALARLARDPALCRRLGEAALAR